MYADDIQVQLEQSFYEVSESDGTLGVCVTASFPSNSQSPVTVAISTSPNTATGNTIIGGSTHILIYVIIRDTSFN